MYAISHQTDTGGPDGTGPFQVTGFANGVLTFAANDDYWQGRPFVDTVEVRPRRAIRDQWLDLSIGRADIVEVSAESLRQAQQNHLSVLTSRPTDLLALHISTNGTLRDSQLRQAVALAVDRSALFNVIFQKQGEITASLLPDELTGYAFLFATDRGVARAHEHRAGAPTPALSLAVENADATLQLASERIALNLREAGFNVQIVPVTNKQGADLVLRRVHLEAASAGAGLAEMLEDFGQGTMKENGDAAALYRIERSFLETYKVVPLLYLPRAYAIGERVRDPRLGTDGTPIIIDVSLEDTK
jgi:ABC-type transport system substrate-binding protein